MSPRWDTQEPHKHSAVRRRYPEAGLSENYCRNPSNSKQSWCYTTDPDTRWEYCDVPTCGGDEPACEDSNPETCGCDEVREADYRGTLSKTQSGVECQRWDSNDPHDHKGKINIFPKAGLLQNYCRNPNNSKRAWCYTTDEDKRWEYCDVPKCGGKKPECEGSNPDTCGCSEVRQADYRGTISTTESGRECQKWDNSKINRWPEGGLMENYCRNPSGSKKAWCYTTDKKKRWEYCDVPTCAGAQSPRGRGSSISAVASVAEEDDHEDLIEETSIDEEVNDDKDEIEPVCSKYETNGWHSGSYVKTLEPEDSPDGMEWQWEECAKACAENDGCEFWSLKLTPSWLPSPPSNRCGSPSKNTMNAVHPSSTGNASKFFGFQFHIRVLIYIPKLLI